MPWTARRASDDTLTICHDGGLHLGRLSREVHVAVLTSSHDLIGHANLPLSLLPVRRMRPTCSCVFLACLRLIQLIISQQHELVAYNSCDTWRQDDVWDGKRREAKVLEVLTLEGAAVLNEKGCPTSIHLDVAAVDTVVPDLQ